MAQKVAEWEYDVKPEFLFGKAVLIRSTAWPHRLEAFQLASLIV